MRCVGQRLERACHAEHDEVGAGQRQQQRGRSPPEPLQREFPLDAFARQHQPVFVVLDAETDPEAFFLVTRQAETGFGAELAPHLLGDELQQRRTLGQRQDGFIVVDGIDADAFRVRQFEQQFAPLVGLGGDEGAAAEIDDADHHLRQLPGSRLTLQVRKDRRPSDDCQHHQQGEEEEGAPEQALRQQPHSCLPSGTKT